MALAAAPSAAARLSSLSRSRALSPCEERVKRSTGVMSYEIGYDPILSGVQMMLGIIAFLLLVIAVQCFLLGRRSVRTIAEIEKKKDDPIEEKKKQDPAEEQELELVRVQRRSKASQSQTTYRRDLAQPRFQPLAEWMQG